MQAWVPIDVDDDPLEPLRTGHDPALVIEAYGELLALARRPLWHQHAACRGQGCTPWFPHRGESIEPAKIVCASCPVQEPCLAAALEHPLHLDHGIWGHTTPSQRKTMRHSARIEAA